MNANQPGDGKSSPFGQNNGPMPGIDFIKNPNGSAPMNAGVDFNVTPAGRAPTAPKPTDFMAGSTDQQKKGEAPDLDPASEIKDHGGPGFRPAADVPAGSPRQSSIGVGSIGDTRKPFKGF